MQVKRFKWQLCLSLQGTTLQLKLNWPQPNDINPRLCGEKRASMSFQSHFHGFKAVSGSVRFEEVLNLILFKTCNPLKEPTAKVVYTHTSTLQVTQKTHRLIQMTSMSTVHAQALMYCCDNRQHIDLN